jgi:hypothetical protein
MSSAYRVKYEALRARYLELSAILGEVRDKLEEAQDELGDDCDGCQAAFDHVSGVCDELDAHFVDEPDQAASDAYGF